MEKFANSLKQELSVAKSELAKWRGFTEEMPNTGSGERE